MRNVNICQCPFIILSSNKITFLPLSAKRNRKCDEIGKIIARYVTVWAKVGY